MEIRGGLEGVGEYIVRIRCLCGVAFKTTEEIEEHLKSCRTYHETAKAFGIGLVLSGLKLDAIFRLARLLGGE